MTWDWDKSVDIYVSNENYLELHPDDLHLVLEGLEQVLDLILADASADEVDAALRVAAAPLVVPLSAPLADSPKEIDCGQTRGHV